MRLRAFGICALLLATLVGGRANAWSRPGHMVTAAIAWQEIVRQRPDLPAVIGSLLLAHPDRGPFQVAIDRTTGVEQARRLFLECARWPDDARGTAFDQPSWHVSLTRVQTQRPGAPADASPYRGQAEQAMLLAYATLADQRTDSAQRAQALCWLLHVLGDLHQPLHAAEFFSTGFPQGDEFGGKRFVKDPLTGAPTNLHWLWDDSILRSGAVTDVDARATTLLQEFPRDQLDELRPTRNVAALTTAVRDESIALARTLAFRADVSTSTAGDTAPVLAADYWREVERAASKRVALAGYRLGDLVIAALPPK